MEQSEHNAIMNQLKKINNIVEFTEQQLFFPESVNGYWKVKSELFPQYNDTNPFITDPSRFNKSYGTII